MSGGGGPWYDDPAWHHRPGPFGLLMAASGFCLGLLIVGDIVAGLAAAVLGGLVGFFMWLPSGFGWRMEAEHQDRSAKGEADVRPEFLVRGVLISIGVVAALLGLAVLVS